MARDDHVEVVWNNIRPDKMSNFQIEQSGDLLDAPYDYLSVMHYSALTFSKNPDDKVYTMVPKDTVFPADRLGQRFGFSPVDIQQVLSFYKCPQRFVSTGFIEDLAAPSSNFPLRVDPQESHAKLALQLLRQARNEEVNTISENELQTPQSSLTTTSSIDVDQPMAMESVQTFAKNGDAARWTQSVSLCDDIFAPDAVLNFLGFFYLFKGTVFAANHGRWRTCAVKYLNSRNPIAYGDVPFKIFLLKVFPLRIENSP